MCYYGLSNAFMCKWSENDVCGIISVAMVTYANFTEVLEIQISLLVIFFISLNLKVQSPITALRFTGAQRMLCATPLKKSAITIYVSIHLHLALDYPYLTAKFQRPFYQQYLLYYFYIKNEMAMWATGNLYSPAFDQSIVSKNFYVLGTLAFGTGGRGFKSPNLLLQWPISV